MDNNYYGTIPAVIRYDKTLKDLDKLVYCDIDARSNSKGFCWPSNEAIGKGLGGKQPNTISISISRLVKAGYVERRPAPELKTKRTLHPLVKITPPLQNQGHPPVKIKGDPPVKITPKNSKEKKLKEVYGEYGNVRLTKKEHEDLSSLWGSGELSDRITRLDEYLEENVKNYKNHSLTMRRWKRNDDEKKGPTREGKAVKYCPHHSVSKLDDNGKCNLCEEGKK